MRASSENSFVSITIDYVIILHVIATSISNYCKYNRTNNITIQKRRNKITTLFDLTIVLRVLFRHFSNNSGRTNNFYN